MIQTLSSVDVAPLTARIAELEEALYFAERGRLAAEERANGLYLDLIRTQEEAQSSAWEFESLWDGLRVLTDALDVHQVFSGMLEVLRGVLAFEHACILVAKGPDQLQVVASTDQAFEGFVSQPQKFFRRVLSGKILAVFDIAQIPEWQNSPMMNNPCAVSGLHVPLSSPGQSAMLVCIHSQRGFFTKKHKDLAERFAVLATQALQNAQMVSALKQERDSLETRVRVRTSELTEQRDFAMHIMNTMAQGLTVIGEDGCFEFVNPAYANMLGIDSEWLIGKTTFEVTCPEDHPILQAAMQEQLDGKTGTYEFRLRRHDGDEVYALITATPRWKNGRMQGSIAVVTDLTQRQVMEDALRRSKEAAEEAAKAKSTFLASMSHEIRTPLNAVIGMTSLLMDMSLNDQQQDFVKIAHHSGETLLTIINDILDYSKYEAGRVELEEQSFSLKQLITSTTGQLTSQANVKELTIATHIAKDIPQFLEGDVTRLSQILLNLLSNAVKFTSTRGTVTLSIFSQGQEDGYCQLLFSVEDNGIGIPPDRLTHLFEPFTQADASTTRRYGGTGLGLSIARQLVELMNGRIWAESELGQGSVFRFTVRLRTADELLQTQSELQTYSVDRNMGQYHPLNILLAEDNSINQKVALHLLERIGYQADVVGNGREVLSALQKQAYDVVLMDVQMPEMDGLTAAQHIEADYPVSERPCIIALTANALEGDRERLLADGMDDYVSKPVRLKDLVAALGRVVR